MTSHFPEVIGVALPWTESPQWIQHSTPITWWKPLSSIFSVRPPKKDVGISLFLQTTHTNLYMSYVSWHLHWHNSPAFLHISDNFYYSFPPFRKKLAVKFTTSMFLSIRGAGSTFTTTRHVKTLNMTSCHRFTHVFDIKIPNKKRFLRHETSAETHLTSTCAKGSPDPDWLTVTTKI